MNAPCCDGRCRNHGDVGAQQSGGGTSLPTGCPLPSLGSPRLWQLGSPAAQHPLGAEVERALGALGLGLNRLLPALVACGAVLAVVHAPSLWGVVGQRASVCLCCRWQAPRSNGGVGRAHLNSGSSRPRHDNQRRAAPTCTRTPGLLLRFFLAGAAPSCACDAGASSAGSAAAGEENSR